VTPAYVPGAVTTVPTAAQVSTERETFPLPLDQTGTLTLKARHTTGPGAMYIHALYCGALDDRVRSLATNSSSLHDSINGTISFEDSHSFDAPSSGSLITIEITPEVLTTKIATKATDSIASEVGTSAKGEHLVVEARATGKYGKTSSGEQTEEYQVSYLTGAFDMADAASNRRISTAKGRYSGDPSTPLSPYEQAPNRNRCCRRPANHRSREHTALA
jgi:hypothetical protein